MRYRVTYRPDLDLQPEQIEADEVTVEDTAIVFRGSVLVIGRPRTVVARRQRTADVLGVEVDG